MKPTNKPHPQLSTDLYRNIVELICPLDKATLASLCVTCHDFYLESARPLYHTIYLKYSACGSHTHFLQTMVTSPRCAQLVQDYTSSYDHTFAGDTVLFMSALHSMENLVSLAYASSVQSARSFADEVTGHCTFPHLERLRWTCFRNKGHLCQFLQRHPSLRILIVPWPSYHPEIRLPFGAIPNLEYVEGKTSDVDAFLPGRNVQRLSWKADYPFVRPFLSPGVHRALCNLRQLALRGESSDQVLQPLVKDLQELEVLQIEWLANWKLDSLVNTINSLPCLRSMIVTDHHRVGDPHLFALNIFESCHPKLNRVYIDDGTKQQMYNRFSLTPDRLVVESIRVRIEGHWMEAGVIESPKLMNFS